MKHAPSVNRNRPPPKVVKVRSASETAVPAKVVMKKVIKQLGKGGQAIWGYIKQWS